MSAHSLPREMLIAAWQVTDPKSGGTFDLSNKGRAWCAITTLAAEGRTVPAPEKVGQMVHLYLDTDGGDCTLTITSGHGITSIVLDDAGDYVTLQAITVGGALKWQAAGNSGVASGLPTVNFAADALTIGGIIVDPDKTIVVNLPLNSQCIDQAFFTADRAYRVTRIDYVHATAGNDAGSVNVQVTKDTGTDAPGAGTDLLTNNTNAGFNCKATANTVQNGTLTGTAASLALAAGNRLSLDFAGTVTTLAGVQVTVTLVAI